MQEEQGSTGALDLVVDPGPILAHIRHSSPVGVLAAHPSRRKRLYLA
jgi:hypothetical protein